MNCVFNQRTDVKTLFERCADFVKTGVSGRYLHTIRVFLRGTNGTFNRASFGAKNQKQKQICAQT